MKYKHIKEFRFNKAKYDLSDENGIKIQLVVDYKKKSFKVNPKNGVLKEHVYHEINDTAKDLLQRKHGVNFAEI